MIRAIALAAGTIAAALLSAPLPAKVVALDLPGMLAVCEDALHGVVGERRVVRIDHPLDGPELYYTTISITGRSLIDGSERSVDVTFPGGFLAPDEGVFNSESPTDEETAPGSEIVVFHSWTDNMGGDVSGQCLIAGHGGLYRVQSNRRGDRVVLGRGPGYAVAENARLAVLTREIERLSGGRRR